MTETFPYRFATRSKVTLGHGQLLSVRPAIMGSPAPGRPSGRTVTIRARGRGARRLSSEPSADARSGPAGPQRPPGARSPTPPAAAKRGGRGGRAAVDRHDHRVPRRRVAAQEDVAGRPPSTAPRAFPATAPDGPGGWRSAGGSRSRSASSRGSPAPGRICRVPPGHVAAVVGPVAARRRHLLAVIDHRDARGRELEDGRQAEAAPRRRSGATAPRGRRATRGSATGDSPARTFSRDCR